MDTEHLPPWGVMEEAVMQQVLAAPPPLAFRLGDGSIPSKDQWLDWRADLVNQLSRVLWPTYDAGQSKWTRRPDRALIQADFELLADLHGEMITPVNGQAATPTLHRVFFDEEDGDIGVGVSYERYDPGLPQYLRDDLKPILLSGVKRRVGSLHFQLKQQFQRPRAFQVAFMQKVAGFACIWAQTGNSPAFISGHCVQAALAGASAFALFGSVIDPVSVDVLKQFTVDIGDRRVFAGVHYPSDNLGSWLTAFVLLPRVFDSAALPAVRAFLWDAINSKSKVFEAVRHYKDTNGDSPYRDAIQLIKELAQAPA